MAIQSRETLKTFFKEGQKPNEQHFADLIESLSHKNEIIRTDVEYASILEAREGTVASKAMSPFLVFEAIKVLVVLANIPTLKTEIETLISNNTSDLRNGVSEAYDTLSEIVSLVDTKATPANISTAINGLKGSVSAEFDSLEKIQGFIQAIQAVLESDTDTLNSLQELVNYTKNNRADITSILSDKLSVSSLINNLDSTSTTTAPTANTVRLLKEMIEALNNVSLGETSGTAYRGDRGKTAYDHSQSSHAPTNAQKNSDITKAEIEAKLTGEISTHSHNIESEVWAILEKKHSLGYPFNLSVSSVTHNSISLSWDAYIFGDGLFRQDLKWQIFYGTNEFEGSGTYIEVNNVDDRTATIPNLNAQTQYHIYLRVVKPNEQILGNGCHIHGTTTQAVANVPLYSTHNSNWTEFA